jgi:hypothetical protein
LVDSTSGKSLILIRTGATFNYAGIGGAEAALYTANNNLNLVADGGAIKFNAGSLGTTTEGMRLTSTGLGIGTSSPSAKLHVKAGSNQNLLVSTSSSVLGLFAVNDPVTAPVSMQIQGLDLRFNTGTSTTVENLRLDAFGNLGLGVTPSAWWSSTKAFQVGASSSLNDFSSSGNRQTTLANNAYLNASAAWTYSNTDPATRYHQTGGQHQWLNAASGTAGNTISFTQAMTLDASGRLLIGVTSGSRIVTVAGSSQMSHTYTGSSAGLDFGQYNSSGDASINNTANANLLFATNNTERARIDSSGNLLVGTTSSVYGTPKFQSVNASDVSALFRNSTNTASNIQSWINTASGTRYHMAFADGTTFTERGSIATNGTVTVYNTTSDYRLKNNQLPLTGSGAFIDALKPKSWTWSEDGSKGVGFIAHEFAEVSPSSVSGEKDAVKEDGSPAYQSMQASSSEIIANLVAEIQSLRQRLAAANL